jgi:ATP-dependent Clp protease adapter protein ClpS
MFTRDIAETKAAQVNQYAAKASIRYSVKSRRTVNADHLGMR